MAEEAKAERTVVKKVKNAVYYSDGTLRVTDIRISYPHLDKKWCKNPAKDTPAFSCVGILPKETHQEAIDLCLEVVDIILKEQMKGERVKADAKFIRDGDLAAKPEYENAYTINSREENRPIVLNPDKSEMDIEDIKPTITAGHYTDMLIQPWLQNNEHGKRVNASLRAVRYRREGPALTEGSGISKETAISSFDDDEDGGFGGDTDDENGGL